MQKSDGSDRIAANQTFHPFFPLEICIQRRATLNRIIFNVLRNKWWHVSTIKIRRNVVEDKRQNANTCSSDWKDITSYPSILTFNSQHPNDYSFMRSSSSGSTSSLLAEHIKLAMQLLCFFTTRRCRWSWLAIRYRYQRRLLPPGYRRVVKAMRYVVLPQVYTHTWFTLKIYEYLLRVAFYNLFKTLHIFNII